ncbi:hypothetical protein [Methylocystis sp.]|uniref:tetratricopeptide repeat protein n=1 Tax=Methylocystis sp. TaxID=1911079 RepID=UPI0025D30C8B|nr:hypothetical protein [Methylocystis sp.]
MALIGYKGVQALIPPPPLIDQQAIENKIEEGKIATETHHKEELTAIDKLRIEIAREKGVPPQVLAPIFENLGMLNLTPDQMREKADEAIKAILARASQKIEKTGDGADIDKAIAASRAKLAGLDTAAAQSILDRKIAEEEEERNKRLVALLEEKAAVARLSYDYPTAKATLERLLKIDPDRVWSWIDLGDIWVTTGSLNQAMKAFQGAEGAARRVNDERDLSVSYERIGDVQVAQGDLKAALQSYADGRAIRERLAKADPGNAQWQRDLSVSYERIGDVQVAQGDLKAALQSYADSRAIRERLAKADPGNAGWQRDLSVSYNKIGDVQVAQGDLKAALQSYSDGRAITERLAKADPGNAEWQRDLSVNYNKIGDVQVAQGDLKAALQSYAADLAIAERLAKADPGNAEWQRDLSVSYAKLATVYEKSGAKTQARDALNAGRAIIAILLKDHPDSAQWKRDLEWFDSRRANLDQLASTAAPENKPIKKKRRRNAE